MKQAKIGEQHVCWSEFNTLRGIYVRHQNQTIDPLAILQTNCKSHINISPQLTQWHKHFR